MALTWLVDELQSLRVAVAVRDNRRLEDDRAADDVHTASA
jgi:hypothetical protein